MNSTTQNSFQAISFAPPRGLKDWGVMLSAGAAITIAFLISKEIAAILLFLGFGGYGFYRLMVRDTAGWFRVVCFLAGAESIIRNGLPFGYFFFFYFLLFSGISWQIFVVKSRVKSSVGIILTLLLAILQFVNLDVLQISYGLGKWGVMWLSVYFSMAIVKGIQLRRNFAGFAFHFLLGGLVVLLSFLLTPHYFKGRFWPTFDGTGPVATIIGVVFILSFYFASQNNIFSRRSWLWLSLSLMCTVAMAMLASRGTVFAIAGVLIIYLIMRKGIFSKIIVLVIMIGVFQFIKFADEKFGKDSLTLRIQEASEDEYREPRGLIAQAVLLSFEERPIIGGGTGSWRDDNYRFMKLVFRRLPKGFVMADTHNTILQILYEHGIVGALILLGSYVYFLRRGFGFLRFENLPVFYLLIYSILLGLSTMHKLGCMFLPFILCAMQRQPSVVPGPAKV